MSEFSEIDNLPKDLVENASRFGTERMSGDICFKYFLYLSEISHNRFFESLDDFRSYLLEKSDKFAGTKAQLIESNGGTTGGIISFTTNVNLEAKDHRQNNAKVEFSFTESPLNPKSKKVYLGDITLI